MGTVSRMTLWHIKAQHSEMWFSVMEENVSRALCAIRLKPSTQALPWHDWKTSAGSQLCQMMLTVKIITNELIEVFHLQKFTGWKALLTNRCGAMGAWGLPPGPCNQFNENIFFIIHFFKFKISLITLNVNCFVLGVNNNNNSSNIQNFLSCLIDWCYINSHL